jgi:hypothetical protein
LPLIKIYPPIIPSNSDKACVKIIRREDATIVELVKELIQLLRSKEINKNGIVLIHSLSHMSKTGTEGHIEDLLMGALKLRAVLGQQVQVVPLPHLLLAGCTCPMTIHMAAEVTALAAKVYGEDGRFLTGSFQKANYLLSPRTGARGQDEKMIRLPVTTMWPSSKATWVMARFDLNVQIKPTCEQSENEIVRSIIGELRTGLALPLEQAPVTGGEPDDGPEKTDYLVIGRTRTATMVELAKGLKL